MALFRPLALLAATTWLVAVGCTSGAPACIPGTAQVCACTSGMIGAQSCDDTGQRFGPCVCAGPPDAGPGTDAGTDPCLAHATCEACTPVAGCGFCDGRCVSGSAAGPRAGTCQDRWRWMPAACAAAPTAFTYVISEVQVDPDEDPARPHAGFNLDGRCSDGLAAGDCGHPDYVSALDADQNQPDTCTMPGPGCRGCVDNQFARLAIDLEAESLGDPRSTLPAAVQTHRLVYLIQVTGVDSLVTDETVRVSVYQGFPTFTTGCDGVQPDREYQVARRSLRGSGASLADVWLVLDGRIVRGRLDVQGGPATSWVLPIDLASGAVTLPLAAPRLRVDLASGRGTRGNLGGRVTGDEFVSTFCAASTPLCTEARTLVGSLVDLEVGGVCAQGMASPPRFGDIGLGLSFQLLPARIRAVSPIADTQAPGTCGS